MLPGSAGDQTFVLLTSYTGPSPADPSDKWTGIDVGIGDPTRFGSAPTGQHYLLSGQASANCWDPGVKGTTSAPQYNLDHGIWGSSGIDLGGLDSCGLRLNACSGAPK